MNVAILLLIAATSMRPGGDMRDVAMGDPVAASGTAPTVTIGAMPFTRTVTCTGSYTLTGTSTGATSVAWAAEPSGESGACTGTDSWSCVVAVSPDATGEGVEVIAVAALGDSGTGNDTETIGFLPTGSHSCFWSQDIDGTYNSSLTDFDPVETWDNRGSSGLDVTHSTVGQQAEYRVNQIAGQPVLRSGGSARLFAASASDWAFLNNSADWSMVVVYNPTDFTTAVQTIVGTQTAAGGATSRGHTLFHDNRTGSAISDRIRSYASNGAAQLWNMISADNAAVSGIYHSAVVIHDDDATSPISATLLGDEASLATAAVTNAYSASAPAGVFSIFTEPDGGQKLTGDIMLVLIYQSALTATQQGIINDVLEWAMNGSPPWTASIPTPTEDWLFIGDSLTEGKPNVVRWQDRLIEDAGPTVAMRTSATGGATAAEILAIWDIAKDPVPDRVFILGGTNDVVQASDTMPFVSLSAIYADAQSLGVEVVALTPLPLGLFATWNETKQGRLEALIADIAASDDVDFYVDLYVPMGDPLDAEDLNAAFALDTVHPNNAGTLQMATTVEGVLGI